MPDQEIQKVETERIVLPSAAPEVDVQIATAKKYPRSVKAVLSEAQSMACLDDATAASMAYALPRAGKTIEGPSVRLAEIMASAWGNLRVDTKIIDADATHVTGEAMCWDLEKNVAIRWQVKRRITDKYGKRYNDDMIVVTGNAASAIAFRNAVFKVIPGSYVKQILASARKVALGDAKNLSVTRQEAIAVFARFGITEDRILATLGRASLEDVDIDDVAKLRGFFTSIRDENADVQEIFPPVESDDDKARKDELREKLKKGSKLNGAGSADTKPKTDTPARRRPAQTQTESPKDDDQAVSYGDGVDTPAIVNVDDEQIDPITGEVLNVCKACDGSGESSSGKLCVPCSGSGRVDAAKADGQMELAPAAEPAPAKAPPTKPKAASKKKGKTEPIKSHEELEQERANLIAQYIDVCQMKDVETGNISKLTNNTLRKKIAELTKGD
jgi:hypothetical protein